MTHHRIGYLAGSLAVTQGAVVEMLVDKAMHDAKEELDKLAQVMMKKDASHTEIVIARSALKVKLKPEIQTEQDLLDSDDFNDGWDSHPL